ncbi:MAG TPA: hypothetical protein VGQ89_01140 [Candidatus Limnocylindrales bacterium]|nr:hypothetical protein [Candidatus Limnocylindrales bacterium]
MNELTVLLPITAFLALAIGFAIVLRRAGRIVARTREIEGFRSSVRDLTTRIDQSLEGAAGRIDAVRRGQLGADTIGPTIEAATDAVTRYTEEARALKGPAVAAEVRDALVDDLERAERALGMVNHGAGIVAQVRRRGRELEAQTSIKRGYLNLIHAREAIVRHAAAAEELELPPADAPQPKLTKAAKRTLPVRQSRP